MAYSRANTVGVSAIIVSLTLGIMGIEAIAGSVTGPTSLVSRLSPYWLSVIQQKALQHWLVGFPNSFQTPLM